MINRLKSLVPGFSHIQEHALLSDDRRGLGYQSTLITSDGYPYSGGTHRDLNEARRICAAEAIERAYFGRELRQSNVNSDPFMLTQFPTTCGFAAGFDDRSTQFRSVCEAVERWAWSKWIDEGYGLAEVRPKLDGELEHYFESSFDKIISFQTPVRVQSDPVPQFVPMELVFSVVIGIKGGGVFPGSRVTTRKDNPWEHSLLEAWRHKKIYENELASVEPDSLYDKRIKRFGDEGLGQLQRLQSSTCSSLPTARLILHKPVVKSQGYFVWRSLCGDFIGWDKGDDSRFIY